MTAWCCMALGDWDCRHMTQNTTGTTNEARIPLLCSSSSSLSSLVLSSCTDIASASSAVAAPLSSDDVGRSKSDKSNNQCQLDMQEKLVEKKSFDWQLLQWNWLWIGRKIQPIPPFSSVLHSLRFIASPRFILNAWLLWQCWSWPYPRKLFCWNTAPESTARLRGIGLIITIKRLLKLFCIFSQ